IKGEHERLPPFSVPVYIDLARLPALFPCFGVAAEDAGHAAPPGRAEVSTHGANSSCGIATESVSAHLDNHYLGCSRRLRPIGGEADAVDVDNRGTPEREHSSYSLRLLLLCSRFRCSGIDRNTHGLTTTQAHDLGRNIAVRQGDKSKRADFDLLPGRQR